MSTTTSTSSTSSSLASGGLASGIDTATIVDKLVEIASAPLTLLQNQRTAYQAQLSALGTIASRLSALETAADGLAQDGVVGTKVSSANTAFSAAAGATAAAGRYTVQVDALARAAKWRSDAFGASSTVAGGTLALRVQGTDYDPITIADGTSLADVAEAIRASGAPVSAVVLNDGTNSYLSITARDTGHPLSGAASDALSISFTAASGATGQPPGFAETQAARNATIQVDGLTFTRRSNTIADAIPGTTLTLEKEGGLAEDLVLDTDPDASEANLKKFVDAYNGVMSLVQKQLAVTESTDRDATLAGDPSIRSLQSRLQSIVTTVVPGLGGIRSLADVGLKTARDGSLSIDDATFQRALANDPSALNDLFSQATTGIGDVVEGFVDLETRAGDGVITLRKSSLDRTLDALDDQETTLQARIDKYRETLLAQFTAMEETISKLKSVGSYLSAQDSSD